MLNFLNKVFKLEENKTTVKTEIIAGVTTFFAMCYIVVLNPIQMINDAIPTHPHLFNAAFIGGIIAAVVATLCMAFIANKPFALAAGMGLNSFFFVSFILPSVLPTATYTADKGYSVGLTVILLSGLLFLILSLTGLRKYIATSLPKCLKIAIPAGIGLFIAFLGLRNSGLVVNNEFTSVALADFTSWKKAAGPLVAFIGVIIIAVLSKSKIGFLKNGAIIFGILGSTAIYYIFSIFTPSLRISASDATSIGTMFSDFFKHGLFNFDFKATFNGEVLGSLFSAIMIIITYCLVDMFDTIGTLYGASAQSGMLDENGDPVGVQEEMMADSIGTVVGACTGTSTITTFVESASGVAAGGRTGLTAFTTAVLFFLCLFAGPLVSFIPSVATAPALIYVGVLMFKGITGADFSDSRSAVTTTLTVLMMVLTYSISNGIMIGAISYVLITLLTGKFTKKDIVVTIIAVLGALRFAFVTM